jgi:thiamine transport system substrate-binding protein
MRLFILFIIFILPASLVSKEQLNILTYDSFISEWGPGVPITEKFESNCNCKINWSAAESSGAMLSRIKLTNNKEGFDIVLGLDDNLMSEAKDSQLFANHSLPLDYYHSSSSLSNLTIDWEDKIFLPFDYGYFGFVYRKNELENPPKSFDELVNHKDLKIIIMDPRTSTPGLGLAKWIHQLYGGNSIEHWKKLQNQIHITAKSWSDAYGLFMTGEGNVVLSYTTSPAYHAIMEQDDNYDVMLFEEGHTMQVEVLGVLKSAPNKKLLKIL